MQKLTYKNRLTLRNKVWPDKNSRLRHFFILRNKFLIYRKLVKSFKTVRVKKKVKRGYRIILRKDFKGYKNLTRRFFLALKSLKWIKNRRNFLPFSYSQKNKKTKRNYAIGLYNKKQLRAFYALNREYQLYNNYKYSFKQGRDFKEKEFFRRLEGRLDIFFYRLRLLPTLHSSREYIQTFGLNINGDLVKKPDYVLQIGDIVSVNDRNWEGFYRKMEIKLNSRNIGMVRKSRRERRHLSYSSYLLKELFNRKLFFTRIQLLSEFKKIKLVFLNLYNHVYKSALYNQEYKDILKFLIKAYINFNQEFTKLFKSTRLIDQRRSLSLNEDYTIHKIANRFRDRSVNINKYSKKKRHKRRDHFIKNIDTTVRISPKDLSQSVQDILEDIRKTYGSVNLGKGKRKRLKNKNMHFKKRSYHLNASKERNFWYSERFEQGSKFFNKENEKIKYSQKLEQKINMNSNLISLIRLRLVLHTFSKLLNDLRFSLILKSLKNVSIDKYLNEIKVKESLKLNIKLRNDCLSLYTLSFNSLIKELKKTGRRFYKRQNRSTLRKNLDFGKKKSMYIKMRHQVKFLKTIASLVKNQPLELNYLYKKRNFGVNQVNFHYKRSNSLPILLNQTSKAWYKKSHYAKVLEIATKPYLDKSSVNSSTLDMNSVHKILLNRFSWKKVQRSIFANELMRKRQRSMPVRRTYRPHWFTPSYIEFDFNTMRGGFISKPSKNEIFYPFVYDMQKLISFYKRRGS